MERCDNGKNKKTGYTILFLFPARKINGYVCRSGRIFFPLIVFQVIAAQFEAHIRILAGFPGAG